jgi:hypothetical protein
VLWDYEEIRLYIMNLPNIPGRTRSTRRSCLAQIQELVDSLDRRFLFFMTLERVLLVEEHGFKIKFQNGVMRIYFSDA